MISRIFAIVIVIILLPLFVLIAITIIIEDGFPFIFKQKRIGVNSSYFYIYKFRSMKADTPQLATHLLSNPQSYLLKSGRVLRKSSLDELPNLFNIIKGDMVFVGPRPALYNQNDLNESRVLLGISKLKPGITGWAQINGRDELSIPDKVKLEHEYLKKKSIYFDLKIIFYTIVAISGNKGIKH
jgi:O-antigen biosynthesis protein WbqP